MLVRLAIFFHLPLWKITFGSCARKFLGFPKLDSPIKTPDPIRVGRKCQTRHFEMKHDFNLGQWYQIYLGHVLSTESLAKSDSGVLITCEAVNSLGKASRETQLQVSGKLNFLSDWDFILPIICFNTGDWLLLTLKYISEAMRFGGLSSMTVLISLGALLLLIFVVFLTAFILKLLRQRKSKVLIYLKQMNLIWCLATVYKTGNVRSSSSSSDKIKFGEGQQVWNWKLLH